MSVKPNTGYGYHAYGHNSCKEVTKKTCYNVPALTVVKPAMNVICSEPLQTCVNKPINLPRHPVGGAPAWAGRLPCVKHTVTG